MRVSSQKITTRKSLRLSKTKLAVVFAMLLAAVLGLVHMVRFAAARGAAIEPGISSPGFGPARLSQEVSIRTAGGGSPYVNLSDGRELLTGYSGPAELVEALKAKRVEGRCLASADFDEDGVADLVSGFRAGSAGMVILLRGNVDAIYPNAPEAQRRRAEGTFTEAPFLGPGLVFAVPEAVDFVGAGDFDGDGHWDVVAARRGGSRLYLLSGDGQGGFTLTREVEVGGKLTALAVGEINRRDGLEDVVVGVSGERGAKLEVYEGPQGALRARPEMLDAPDEVTGLAMGQLDDSYEMDLLVAAGRELMLVHGRDRRLSLDGKMQREAGVARVEWRQFSYRINSIIVGNFTGNHRTDIALIGEDGRLWELSAREKTPDPNKAELKKKGMALWKWSNRLLGSESDWGTAVDLVSARVSSLPADALIVVGHESRSLEVVVSNPDTPNRPSTDGASAGMVEAKLQADGWPAAVLPMRLNGDALSDLVVLRKDYGTISTVLTTAHTDGVSGTFSENQTFSNPSPITINNTGPANPYPSVINVAGLANPVTRLTVTLNGLSHTALGDVDVLLVGPAGQTVMLMSDIDGSASNITLMFDDAAPPLVGGTTVQSGTYAPTNHDNGTPDQFPAPAPSMPYGTSLSGFIGTNPNGAWNLFIIDEVIDDSGNIAGGWSLSIETGIIEPFTVINTNDSGPGSLRQAILNANAAPGVEMIRFNIPGPPLHTIIATTPLPAITSPVIVDGTTQPGFTGTPIVEVGGQGGILLITAGNSAVRSLILSALELDIRGGNIVEGNYIFDRPLEGGGNTFANLRAQASFNNIIGGTTIAARNILQNVQIVHSGGSQIEGNFIGLDPSGTARLPVGRVRGIFIFSSPDNVVGGTTAGARNVISGKSSSEGDVGALKIHTSSGTLVQGNYIGTDATGTFDIDDFQALGIELRNSPNTLIGGTTTTEANVISGNLISGCCGAGVSCEGFCQGTLVQGNFIGTNAGGTVAVPNAVGVSITPKTDFEDPEELAGTTGVTVVGNLISGNLRDGVLVDVRAFDNTILGNTITLNGGSGVRLPSGPSGSASDPVRIKILSNAIFSNNGLGIDLGPVGVTPNDDQDPDRGANELQNFPVLLSSSAAGEVMASSTLASTPSTVTIRGTYNTTPNSTCTLQFFFGRECAGQGHQFIGSIPVLVGEKEVTTDSSGNVSFEFSFTLPLEATSGFVNCTATSASGNTSEYSQCTAVQASCAMSCPPDQTQTTALSAGTFVSYPNPVFTGPCSDARTVCTPPSGTVFPVGITRVNCSAALPEGGISCNFGVTVVFAGCAINCPPNQTVVATSHEGANVTYPEPVLAGNCSGATIECVPPSGSKFAQGTTTVNCSVSDRQGSRNTCSFAVTVNASCELACPPDLVIEANSPAGSIANYSQPGGCGSTPVTCNPPAGSTFPIGTTTVTCTASSTTGLESMCGFKVTVTTPIPHIDMVVKDGKNLIVEGRNFTPGSVILLRGEARNTKFRSQAKLIGKKAGKRIASGDRIQVRAADGGLSNEVVYP